MLHKYEIAVFKAIENNDIDSVKKYLDLLDSLGILNINVLATDSHSSMSFLYLAMEKDNISIFKLLLSYPDIDVNIKCGYGEYKVNIIHKTKYYDIEFLKQLLTSPNSKNIIDVNSLDEDSMGMLHKACVSGNLEIVKLLLEHPNIDVNLKNFSGNTPLHITIEYSYSDADTDILKLLLAHPDIDINAKNNKGDSFLHLIYREYKLKYINLFSMFIYRDDIDLNIKNVNGETILYQACYEDYIEIVKLLLARPNIDVNTKNVFGNSILHDICVTDSMEQFKLLFAHPKIKIDFNYRKIQNLDIKYLLKKKHNPSISEIFKILDSIED